MKKGLLWGMGLGGLTGGMAVYYFMNKDKADKAIKKAYKDTKKIVDKVIEK